MTTNVCWSRSVLYYLHRWKPLFFSLGFSLANYNIVNPTNWFVYFRYLYFEIRSIKYYSFVFKLSEAKSRRIILFLYKSNLIRLCSDRQNLNHLELSYFSINHKDLLYIKGFVKYTHHYLLIVYILSLSSSFDAQQYISLVDKPYLVIIEWFRTSSSLTTIIFVLKAWVCFILLVRLLIKRL